ncbi:DUF1593-domain-containing protein [Daldinia eschscholtzii]|nr:DUF1593-domain-containing protein [Daldinia eschscholtzii]
MYAFSYRPFSGQCRTSRYQRKPKLFVLTDLGNQPDDQMSLVRLLTYSNEIDIRGIAAVTSTWLQNITYANVSHAIIQEYGNVVDNLNAHVPSEGKFPSPEELLSTVTAGHSVYDLAALKLNMRGAAIRLISEADHATSTDPLYISAWGGANVLAEALNYVSNTRNQTGIATFVARLRVYAISDQDDTGFWVWNRYPKLFYVVSANAFNYYHFDQGGPGHLTFGKLGAHYPNFTNIMEGDTPSFLPLVQNGLGNAEHPEWGSWGGCYGLLDTSDNSRIYTTTADVAVGINNATYVSAQASIWRWRETYQNDFVARMGWTLSDTYKNGNHHLVVVVNGTCGPDAMSVDFKAGEPIVFDASASWDPDNDELSFEWINYQEVFLTPFGKIYNFIDVERLDEKGAAVRVTAHTSSQYTSTAHIPRELGLATYRRIILKHERGG